MKRYGQYITLMVAVLFSFPLVYQSLHQLEHLMPKSYCCEHHDIEWGEIFSAAPADSPQSLLISLQDEACPVCDYEHTAYSIPGDPIKPSSLYYSFGVLNESYQAPYLSVQVRHLSLRAPPIF